MKEIKETKVCSRCKEEMELNKFGKNKNLKNGIQSWCKSCDNKNQKNQRTKNREANKTLSSEEIIQRTSEKICATCQIKKSSQDFCINLNTKDGLCGQCKDCHNKRSLKRYQSFDGRFSNIKSNAKKRKIDFSLSKEECHQHFENQPCIYCGDKDFILGLDRIDSDQGYTVENCVSCCRTCNVAKAELSETEFYIHFMKMFKYTQKTRPNFWQKIEESNN